MATLTADMKTFIENNLAWITTVDKDGNVTFSAADKLAETGVACARTCLLYTSDAADEL